MSRLPFRSIVSLGFPALDEIMPITLTAASTMSSARIQEVLIRLVGSSRMVTTERTAYGESEAAIASVEPSAATRQYIIRNVRRLHADDLFAGESDE